MHDPSTVAFEIRYPWRAYRHPTSEFERTYRRSFITIWHEDPQTDGSDDSCGWFMRARHGDKAVLAKIKSDFEFNWDADYGGWFDKDGKPVLSTSAIVLGMFWHTIHRHFGTRHAAAKRFARRHLFDILHFAENPTDSAAPLITNKYGTERRDRRIEEAAAMIYGCVLRWSRPWYRHPRWHVWHWRFQVHPWQQFRRWAFTRCAGCGKRFGWGYAPVKHGWHSEKPKPFCSEVGAYHHECSAMATKLRREPAAGNA